MDELGPDYDEGRVYPYFGSYGNSENWLVFRRCDYGAGILTMEVLSRYTSLVTTGEDLYGKLHWTWCFDTSDYSLFKIDKSRGRKVLEEMPGKGGCEINCVNGHRYVKLFNQKNLFRIRFRITT